MFNTNLKMGSNSQTVNLNTPSTGMLQRSNPKSIFVTVEKGSVQEKNLFPNDGSTSVLYRHNYNTPGYDKYKETKGRVDVIILQVLIFGANSLMIECIEPKYLIEI